MGQQENILDYYSVECDSRKQFVAQGKSIILERSSYSYRLEPEIGNGWMDLFQISYGVTLGRACFYTPFHCQATDSPGMIALFVVVSGRLDIESSDGHILESYQEGSVGLGYRKNIRGITISYQPDKVKKKAEVVSIDIPVTFFSQLFPEGSCDFSALRLMPEESCLIRFDHICRHCALSVANSLMCLDCRQIKDFIRIESSVLNLVNMLASHFKQLTSLRGTRTNQRYYEKVRDVMAILEEQFHQKHTIASLARYVGLNECYLKVAFKELTGQTIAEFQRSIRLNQAKKLLETKSYNVTEIAHNIGYSNPGHFAAAFKREFGISPSGMKLIPK
ncbi:AraC family transcriptional regulator [Vibrio mangrovi]|uniref:AraC family transcriptional regulator n=1 Tax=Vibrio mangrovi TaxID=474394 RepID=A0A1Y6IVE8_9VIBR|nr:AraC family transcriptional regulator [Vibrio mangrovi]MDW6002262.1 AraC family transcriptional regulator [Vibrio mangrovi]SMS01608.1 Regulatory protein PchR [Vibrio mangrovi]